MNKSTGEIILDTLLSEEPRTITIQVVDKELAKKFLRSMYDGTTVEGIHVINWGFNDQGESLKRQIADMTEAIDELHEKYGSDRN